MAGDEGSLGRGAVGEEEADAKVALDVLAVHLPQRMPIMLAQDMKEWGVGARVCGWVCACVCVCVCVCVSVCVCVCV